jgi:hypothetical protein
MQKLVASNQILVNCKIRLQHLFEIVCISKIIIEFTLVQ